MGIIPQKNRELKTCKSPTLPIEPKYQVSMLLKMDKTSVFMEVLFLYAVQKPPQIKVTGMEMSPGYMKQAI